MSGAVANRYAVSAMIGRGGMATVWRAHDTVLEREVALKRLRPSLMSDPESAERFRREAETVARLTHPGLVRLLDRGEDAEGPFLVMELVEGEDLKARIRREGRLDPHEAARICAEVARALDHAHRHGIVHRDIKSQNVLIDVEGRAKLTDFGIARLMESHADSGLTRTGMLMGSSDYLAPEQAEGRPIDGRTDVYSLGIVLWECLTGRLPFPGDSFLAVAMRHVTDPLPDPRSVAPDIPAHLAACALRAGAKNPAHRFDSANRFAHALEEPESGDTASFALAGDDPALQDTQRGGVRRRRRARRRRALGVLAGAAAAAVVGVGGYLTVQSLTDDAPARTVTPLVRTLSIIGVKDYDPAGSDQREQPDLVSKATDGDPESAWTTEYYRDVPEFGGYDKPGVGLVIRLAAGYRPTSVDITSSTPGATFEIRNGPTESGGVLASGTLAGGTQRVPLAGGAGSTILLWITRLGDVPVAKGYYAAIQEVSVRGVPNRAG